MATVNDVAAQGKLMLLSGEICLTGDRSLASEATVDQALASQPPSIEKNEQMENR